MTEQELKDIEARLAAATPGPWGCNDDNEFTIGHLYAPFGEMEVCKVTSGNLADATFIKCVPTDMRRLLDEVKRLRKDNEELQKLVDKFSEANRRLRIAVANQ
ncbi:hypothetical protein SAMN04489735_10824, partial [Aneurinibacillus thermoaerophilus]